MLFQGEMALISIDTTSIWARKTIHTQDSIFHHHLLTFYLFPFLWPWQRSCHFPNANPAADLKSNLKELATMETNYSEAVFTMLVVAGLGGPILFGENHLHATQALVIDHHVPAVTFRHPVLSRGNPFKGFNSVLAPNASLSQESGATASTPHVSLACLLTRTPPAGVHKRSQYLHPWF